jgi:acyl-CoA thioesterase
LSRVEGAIFIPDGDRFIPTDLARSPWGPHVLHGGPPAGLLARAIEQVNPDPALHIARMTIDLFRPVPTAPLHVTTQFVREGRRIAVIQASLFADDTEVSRASALLLRESEVELPDAHLPAPPSLPGPDGIPTTGLSTMLTEGSPAAIASMPGGTGFHTTIEVRRIGGGLATAGHGTAWIRIPVPFVAGEETSALVRMAATSDFGNALGHIRAGDGIGFINADITIYLHRMPVGEWICLDSQSAGQPHGIGLVESMVHDERGSVGRIVQALLANRRYQPGNS